MSPKKLRGVTSNSLQPKSASLGRIRALDAAGTILQPRPMTFKLDIPFVILEL
jgi:hypothetical protein